MYQKYVSSYKTKDPLILLSGGETTVKIVGNGKGGRNQEFALYVCLFMKKLMPKKLLGPKKFWSEKIWVQSPSGLKL